MNPTTTPQEFVYVIHALGTNRIKLGYSTKPEKRLAGLQTAAPYKLRMIACWPGDRAREDRLHRYMAQFRKIGEWFEVPPFVGYELWKLATQDNVTQGIKKRPAKRRSRPLKSVLVSQQKTGNPALPKGYEWRKDNGAYCILKRWFEWDEIKQVKVKKRQYVGRFPATDVARLLSLTHEEQIVEAQLVIDAYTRQKSDG